MSTIDRSESSPSEGARARVHRRATADESGEPPSDRGSEQLHLTLDDRGATDSRVVGGKAAALARARRADVPTLPGTVLTVRVSELFDAGEQVEAAVSEAFAAARRLLEHSAAPLIVRSSSVVEDQSESSAAGQFESVADVVDLDGFRRAVDTVLRSREAAGAAGTPIGVLVQPQLRPDAGGVLFGVEPVTGRTDRLVIAVVRGRPDALVGGEVEGSRYVLDRDGSVVDATIRDDAELDDGQRRALVAVAHRLDDVFDAPQDVEWAIVDGSLVILQTRPVTTRVRGVPDGPHYGPGTVSETFPEPLTPLERDLWVGPLDEAIRAALVLAGRHTDDELADRPLVITVGGRVALDLDATGEEGGESSRSWVVRRTNRLRNAWRIGRLRAALPSLVDDLLAHADEDLAGFPPFDELSASRAVASLRRSRDALRSLHAHELLVGAISGSSSSTTAASVALRALDGGRRDGLGDEAIVERAPVVLALVPPRIGPAPRLPRDVHVPAWDEPWSAGDDAVRREALRLRVRWLHELTARLSWQLGRRLADRGELPDADAVRWLPLVDLEAVVQRRGSAWWAAVDAARSAHPSDPLPARFRLSDRGLPVPEVGTGSGAVGASPGTAEGTVVLLGDDLEDRIDEVRQSGGAVVLVVRALTPELGSRLGSLAAIVSESGSPLSHLAILAREQGVPVVVGCAGAVGRFPAGSRLRVDGSEGTVEPRDEEAS